MGGDSKRFRRPSADEQLQRIAYPISRSENMRRIRSKDTKPELLLRRALHRLGLRYRLHVKGLPGRPDIVFPRARIAVFVHGCFWHRHPGCREASSPRSRSEYWEPKLDRNVVRDLKHRDDLEELRFRVMVLWECDIERDLQSAVGAVRAVLSAPGARLTR
jgi:DNA mismatch endonuclease (patch repair protein)